MGFLVKGLLLSLVLALPVVVFLLSLLSLALPFALGSGLFIYGGLYGFWPVVCLGPFVVLLLWQVLVVSLQHERDLIEMVGPKYALWHTQSRPGFLVGAHFTKPIYTSLVWMGHDRTSVWLAPLNEWLGFGVPDDVVQEGLTVVASVIWSWHVKALLELLESPYCFWGMFTACLFATWHVLRVFGRFSLRLLHLWVIMIWLVVVLPSSVLSDALWFSVRSLVRVSRLVSDPLALEYYQWWFTALAVDVALATQGFSVSVRKTYSEALSKRRLAVAAKARRTVLDTVKILTDVGLPSYIRTRFKYKNTKEHLDASKEIMAQIGWPINVDHTEPVHVEGAPDQFEDWLVTGTDFRTGLRQLKTYVGEQLDNLSVTALQYKRTEEYQSVANELKSTSRYFQDRNPEFPQLPIDDVWFMLRDIFRHSRLTTFNTVIAAWEKKYALGFYMRDPDRPNSKYKRRRFINTMGYQNFKLLWAKTFYYAAMILPVAHVSVKGEALPEKKWLYDKVRSVIGSPIGHYIATSFFAYGPNHRFAWESTPIKIGMPLNGYHVGQVFVRHAKFQHHAQGDFSDFDSTLENGVKEVIREIRKRGYAAHKDRRRICDLIDSMYDLLDGSMLGMTTTGNVYRKGSGLTTGHSSTSMDNSTALVTLYMMAWKELTGLSAREFLAFNELSCYGDDHILSFSTVRPLSWSFRNISRVMRGWGVVNNLDSGPLDRMSFLKKWASKPTPQDILLFQSANVPVPAFKVWHDKPSLVGKLTARVKTLNPTYRLNRLLSYLELTAHHEDVYKSVVKIITSSTTMMHHLKATKRSIPSYQAIVKAWYSNKGGPSGLDEDDMAVADERLVLYGTPSHMDHVLNFVAMIPDFLNPAIFNVGFMRAAQTQLGPCLTWVVTLLTRQNDIISSAQFSKVSRRTPYEFIEPSLFFGGNADHVNTTSLLLRHWVYLFYCKLRPVVPRFIVGDMLVRKTAALQFLINAKVQLELPSTDLSIDKLLVLSLLSYLTVPLDILAFVRLVTLPDVALILDLAMNKVLSLLWGNIPSNYHDVHVLLKKPRGSKIVMAAGTGTGKSTDFVYSCYHNFSHKFRKVIVIEPRVLLAVGLAPYVSKRFGTWANAGTGATPLDLRAPIIYVTEGTFLNNLDSWKSDFLYIVDECHVGGPLNAIIKRFLEVKQATIVAMSATPRQSDYDWANYSVTLSSATIWKVNVREIPFDGPINRYPVLARDFINSLSVNDRVAVVFDTPEMAADFAVKSDRPSQVLSSKHPPGVMDVPLYCTTNVIDVGVTIPDLDYIVFPNWDHVGSGVRVALSQSLKTQRCGRVGRTRNGHAIVFTSSNVFDPAKRSDTVTKENAKDLIMAGVSPYLLSLSNETAVFDALQMSFDTTDTASRDIALRNVSVFMDNFRPLMMSMSFVPDDVTGEYTVIRPTGMGIASTAKEVDLVSLTPKIWHCVLGVVALSTGQVMPEKSEECLESLAKTPGTNVFVKDLVSWMLDKSKGFPSTNPLSGGLRPTWTDMDEIKRIYDLIKEAEGLA